MSNYTVVVTEVLRREIVVEANNYMDALNQVEDMWTCEDFTLTDRDFDYVGFMEKSTGHFRCI